MPEVICFDLYNTLVYETNEGLVGASSGESHQEIEISIPSYLDYFVQQYGKKYSLTKERVYAYVRDRLMNSKQESFEAMTKLLFSVFVPKEPCTTKKTHSIANTVEWYWRVGSSSAEWIDETFPLELKRLKALGHKVTLITNCTFPAWQQVSEKLNLKKYFDAFYVSCLEGTSKPNNLVWETVESWFPGVVREKFTMVGDREADDLAIPRQRGWKTIHADRMLEFLKEKK